MFLAPAILAASPTLARLAKGAGTVTTTNTDASRQWAKRPEEERYWNLADAATAATAFRNSLTLRDVSGNDADVTVADGKPALANRANGKTCPLSPLAFQQFARLAGAPAGYLATLPAELAAQCLASGWASKRNNDAMRLQIARGGGAFSVRAITTPHHDLLSNADVLGGLARLANASGWKVPPGRVPQGYNGPTRLATAADVLRNTSHGVLGIKEGDTIAPSGVYVSDRDMYVLMVDDSNTGTMDAGEGDALHRFLIISNSEVGQGALTVTGGWLRAVCGNHILWDVRNQFTMRKVHKGTSATRALAHTVRAIAAPKVDDRQDMSRFIVAAKRHELASNRPELVKYLASRKLVSQTMAEDIASVGEELATVDGIPCTAWNTMQAITRVSQVATYADERNTLDMVAAKLAEVVRVIAA